jgi:hypothetical protein
MRNKNLIHIIALLLLIVLFLFIWNNYQIRIEERRDKPIKFPPQISEKCGIENCHGLDIACGPNVPDACTMIYMAGDNCRQFVSCKITNNQCELETTPKFENCKSCVEKCEVDYEDSQIGFFECESGCVK